MPKKIALDVDGVLLNYHTGYAKAWELAFGEPLQEVNPRAYWAVDRYNARRLDHSEVVKLREHMDYDFWSDLDPLEGALEACKQLYSKGYRLICVSALSPEFRQARFENLLNHGFPIEDVVATGNEGLGGMSPKAAAIGYLAPSAFVDDYLPYLVGVQKEKTHLALITREPEGSPNKGPNLAIADSSHHTLEDFADWWLQHH